jgi:sialate O-acetylesterase
MQYRTLLPTLITDWRTRWNVGDFPFLIVELAAFMPLQAEPVQSGWAELREAQAMSAQSLPKCGLASAIDIGDAADIHPRNKQEVGRRLALAARAIAYGQELPYSGPVFKSMEVKDGKAVIAFDHVGEALQVKGEELKGFAISGQDGKFVWAKAAVEGKNVVVWSDEINAPVAVRYNWANNPVGNLYNKAGLPAFQFRTDVK